MHHKLDIAPVPEKVLYINEPWLVDSSLALCEDEVERNAIDRAEDNVRVYIPLDLNKAAILRKLESVIAQYDRVNEKNESAFRMDVELLIAQIEIYDQVWFGRNLPTNAKHSNEAVTLVKEFVARIEDIPDEGAECFPFEAIDALRQEYLA